MFAHVGFRTCIFYLLYFISLIFFFKILAHVSGVVQTQIVSRAIMPRVVSVVPITKVILII